MTRIENPWSQFAEIVESGESYVLDIDRHAIDRFNRRQSNPLKRIFVRSIAEPFIGNPATARLVLLNLNPGHSVEDEQDHRGPGFRAALLANLGHNPQDYPFYPLNPDFAQTTGAGRWWRPLTRRLQQAAGLDLSAFSKRILVIEWFPYHSVRSGLPARQLCPSQVYSFELAERMLQKQGTIVLGMRSRAHWLKVSDAFQTVPFLINRQRPFLTPANMPPGVFDQIVERIKAS